MSTDLLNPLIPNGGSGFESLWRYHKPKQFYLTRMERKARRFNLSPRLLSQTQVDVNAAMCSRCACSEVRKILEASARHINHTAGNFDVTYTHPHPRPPLTQLHNCTTCLEAVKTLRYEDGLTQDLEPSKSPQYSLLEISGRELKKV